MRQTALVIAVLSVATLSTVSSKDFPLALKPVSPQDMAAFPGGYGRTGMLQVTPHPGVSNETKAVSTHPLYGGFSERDEPGTLAFRLDEGGGPGKGYDQLVLDVNDNGDLTDDPVLRPASGYKPKGPVASDRQGLLFGPVEMPASKKMGGWQPLYYGELLIYNPSAITNADVRSRGAFIGYLRLKPACYWEATVELDGRRLKLGLVDGDSNLRLGEPWQSQTYTNSDGVSWYFRPRDSFLMDADGSGRYTTDAFNSEFTPFGSLVYLGGTPCKVALAADCRSVQVEPWKEPLAELDLQPRGRFVHSVTLAWESKPDEWQLIEPRVAGGKAMVPPGNYRLYGCALAAKGFLHKPIMASAYSRLMKTPLRVEAGKAQTLLCGAPLNIKVEANQGPAQPWELRQVPSSGSSEAITMLRINAQVLGAGTEIYSSYGRGWDYQDEPSNPTFTVVDGRGKVVTRGNLEFG